MIAQPFYGHWLAFQTGPKTSVDFIFRSSKLTLCCVLRNPHLTIQLPRRWL